MALPTAAAFRAAFPELSSVPDVEALRAIADGATYYSGDVERLQLLAAANALVVRRMVEHGEDVPTDQRKASSYGKQLLHALRHEGGNALPVVSC